MNEAFIGSAFLIGIGAACWGKIKALLYRLTSLLIVTVKVDGTEMQRAVQLLCWSRL